MVVNAGLIRASPCIAQFAVQQREHARFGCCELAKSLRSSWRTIWLMNWRPCCRENLRKTSRPSSQPCTGQAGGR